MPAIRPASSYLSRVTPRSIGQLFQGANHSRAFSRFRSAHQALEACSGSASRPERLYVQRRQCARGRPALFDFLTAGSDPGHRRGSRHCEPYAGCDLGRGTEACRGDKHSRAPCD